MHPRIEPYMSIQHTTSQRGVSVEQIGVKPLVVVTWWREVVFALAEAAGALPSPHWLYGERQPFFTGAYQGQPVCFVQMPVGAPGTVLIMEEMIACGAKAFLGLGMAGGLQPSSPLGALIVPTTCISEEGTSTHYPLDGMPARADPQLSAHLAECALELGLPAATGPHWTTDAPFRELVSKIEAYREQGVLGVDMETSAMFTLAQYRQVRAANLLVVSDEVWHEWRPGFGGETLRQALLDAQQVILRAIATLNTENTEKNHGAHGDF
ncbi:MAG: nucleoside phosphorylase [Chloroflexota bacterium]